MFGRYTFRIFFWTLNILHTYLEFIGNLQLNLGMTGILWQQRSSNFLFACSHRTFFHWTWQNHKMYVVKSTSFWDITPCSPLSVDRRFGGKYRLHLQGQKNKFSKKLAWTHHHHHLYSWGDGFETRRGHRLSWLWFLWFASVPPAKCRHITLIRPQPLPS
jgi:hypothetical protein